MPPLQPHRDLSAMASPPAEAHVHGAMSPGLKPRVFGLDVLRAAAIFGVVFAHGIPVLYPHVPHIGLLGHGGFYGVELFFVLSGFLIGRILIESGAALAENANLAVFYVRRWFRTLPLFWLFLAIHVGMELYLRERRLPGAEIATHGFFLRTFASYRINFFPESWSLAVEEWFYLLLPAALWLGLRFTRRFDAVFLSTAGLFYLFSTLARVVSSAAPEATWHTSQRMTTVLRFDALMIGLIAAWFATRFPLIWRKAAGWTAGVGIALLLTMYASLWTMQRGYFAASADSFFARTFRFNAVSLGFALLLPMASSWILRRETAGTWVVRKIALWSYAMYLVHLPVLQLTRNHLFLAWQNSWQDAAALLATQLALTVAISALIFHLFEAPCTRWRDKVAPWIRHWLSRSSAP